jgi:hypothetical protein
MPGEPVQLHLEPAIHPERLQRRMQRSVEIAVSALATTQATARPAGSCSGKDSTDSKNRSTSVRVRAPSLRTAPSRARSDNGFGPRSESRGCGGIRHRAASQKNLVPACSTFASIQQRKNRLWKKKPGCCVRQRVRRSVLLRSRAPAGSRDRGATGRPECPARGTSSP